MKDSIEGLHDIHTICSCRRKVGGAIEAESIQLRSGESFHNVAITHVDFSGSAFYFMGIMNAEGEQRIVNVQEVSQIKNAKHKRIHELKNVPYRRQQIDLKLRYLQRFLEVNDGHFSDDILEEIKRVVEDIGAKTVEQELRFSIKEDKSERILPVRAV